MVCSLLFCQVLILRFVIVNIDWVGLQVFLSAKCIKRKVKVSDDDVECRHEVDFKAHVEFDFKEDFHLCILSDLEVTLHVAEDASQNFVQRFVDTAVLVGICGVVCPNVERTALSEGFNFIAVGHLYIVAMEVLE